MSTAQRFFDDLRVGESTVLPERRVIRQSDVDLYLDYSADWHGRWGTAFCTEESLRVCTFSDERPDMAPGILILGQQWGVAERTEPLVGIVATYLLEDIRQVAPLHVGRSYAVRQEIVSLHELPEGLGTVRSRRTLIRDDGVEFFSLIEKARWRTRDRWERDLRERDTSGREPGRG